MYYNITDDVEQNVIEPLAAIFRTSNYQIKPVLKALFMSDHFYSIQVRSCNIKSPVDFIVGLCKEFEVTFPNQSDYLNSYYMGDYLRSTVDTIQHNIGDPPMFLAGMPIIRPHNIMKCGLIQTHY